MGKKTKIDYADHTFSPWIGCTKVSPGCADCYAEAVGRRMGIEWGPDKPRRFMGEKYWHQPTVWNRAAMRAGVRRRVLTSMCDVFEGTADVPGPLPGTLPRSSELQKGRQRLWMLIDNTPWLDWLVLTKRPENMRTMLPAAHLDGEKPLRNIWLGVSVEDQQRADERIPLLLQVPAAVRWVSVEPMLGPVDLTRVEVERAHGSALLNAFTGEGRTHHGEPFELHNQGGINWVVCGCESLGARAGRRFRMQWAMDLRKQCASAGVPMFLKQVPSLSGGLLKSAWLADDGWPVQYP